MPNYLDDYVCNITCEEYYEEDELDFYSNYKEGTIQYDEQEAAGEEED